MAAWVSSLAPVFWFVAARLHVADHLKIDLVVWYIPFAPLVFASIISLAVFIYKSASNKSNVLQHQSNDGKELVNQ
ncbi:MAG: hypothetical protein ACK5JF_10010 [Oscillospiraceae bacterium]